MQTYQELIEEVKDIVEDEIGIMDPDGTILASSDLSKTGNRLPDSTIDKIVKDQNRVVTIENISYCKVYSGSKTVAVTYIATDTEQGLKLLDLFSVSVSGYYRFYLSRLDRATFYRNIIMENLLEHEIINKARELRIPVEAKRIVFLLSVPDTEDDACISVLKNIFPDRINNSIFKADAHNYLLVRTIKDGERRRKLADMAYMIKDTVGSELMVDVRVSIGTESATLLDLKKSYQNAMVADITGRIFEGKEKVADYHKLGIGRLIYRLPEDSCRIFLDEVFPNNTYRTFDEEMFRTIEGLLECNFNISKTAEILFVHRNSVIYRIQKILKLTGLDVRNFNDAVVFKLAMLVSKYLAYIDKEK